MLSEIIRRPEHGAGLSLALILLLGALIGASGAVSLPMDGHEVFVVQTAQEMHDRNDWIVPWFNGEPRLNKPPLNYWLTGAAAWLGGSMDNIGAWHGRLVSLLAGLAMTVLVYIAGTLLYGRRVALLAAAFMVTSLGYFNYSHDARPDMLYAALCSAGYVAFMSAWKAVSSRQQALCVMLMWAAYGLATLSKGPQMPAMYLAASIAFCLMIKTPRREFLKLIRPVSGLIMYASITLPWWYLLQLALGGNGLHGTQLGGSLLTVRFDRIFNLYYFYRPLLLVLPWLIFLPHTILYLRSANGRSNSDKLLLLYILAPALMLSFGSQQRWFYMLPSLPPMLVLLAAGANYMLEQRREPARTLRLLWGLCLATAVIYVFAGHLQAGWSRERFEFYNLAQHALPQAQAGTPVYALDINPDVYVYYLHIRIRKEKKMDIILRDLEGALHDKALVIMHSVAVAGIPDHFAHQVIYTTQDAPAKSLSLVLLGPRADYQTPSPGGR